jgi:hypothetical protein
MIVEFFYQSERGLTQSFSVPTDCQGFVSTDDVEQIVDGLRRETGIEPFVQVVRRSVLALARNRKRCVA